MSAEAYGASFARGAGEAEYQSWWSRGELNSQFIHAMDAY